MGKHGFYMPGHFLQRVVLSNVLLYSLGLFLVAFICQDSMDCGAKLIHGGASCLQIDSSTTPSQTHRSESLVFGLSANDKWNAETEALLYSAESSICNHDIHFWQQMHKRNKRFHSRICGNKKTFMGGAARSGDHKNIVAGQSSQ